MWQELIAGMVAAAHLLVSRLYNKPKILDAAQTILCSLGFGWQFQKEA
jgi:hypothetical protein